MEKLHSGRQYLQTETKVAFMSASLSPSPGAQYGPNQLLPPDRSVQLDCSSYHTHRGFNIPPFNRDPSFLEGLRGLQMLEIRVE
ncbi:hypothetical protein chiPu_0020954 [Chiloscyllium punctatum]|uniref:Uncharacterized protein n=1 Tax=Chiloscyllium punctatum TaxID=137246 RepID=A0A401RLQ6_CHIPU|nr:hypothetical protein [Chiloscyllium punctatum]